MLPSRHIALGLIFSAIVFLIWPQIGLINAGIIFLASFLIDVDHYLYYVMVKRDLSLRNAYKFNLDIRNHHKKGTLNIFHTLEFLILLLIGGIFFKPLFFILIGFTFHILLDISESLDHKDLNLRRFIFLSGIHNL